MLAGSRCGDAEKFWAEPITYGTTDLFMSHFSLASLADLPGMEELKDAGLLDAGMMTEFSMPVPTDSGDFEEDEEPLS